MRVSIPLPSHTLAQCTSVRAENMAKSCLVPRFAGTRGAKKLGQPVPLSYFCSELEEPIDQRRRSSRERESLLHTWTPVCCKRYKNRFLVSCSHSMDWRTAVPCHDSEWHCVTSPRDCSDSFCLLNWRSNLQATIEDEEELCLSLSLTIFFSRRGEGSSEDSRNQSKHHGFI